MWNGGPTKNIEEDEDSRKSNPLVPNQGEKTDGALLMSWAVAIMAMCLHVDGIDNDCKSNYLYNFQGLDVILGMFSCVQLCYYYYVQFSILCS